MENKNFAGFSLIELMTVIVILGILATLAVPRYNRFIAKSRQTEAKTNLGHIAMLQDAYKLEYEEYSNLDPIGDGTCGSPTENNKLGFRPSACEKLRYKYGSNTTFVATGEANDDIYPGCGLDDKWQIDEDRDLKVGDPADIPPNETATSGNAIIKCDQ